MRYQLRYFPNAGAKVVQAERKNKKNLFFLFLNSSSSVTTRQNEQAFLLSLLRPFPRRRLPKTTVKGSDKNAIKREQRENIFFLFAESEHFRRRSSRAEKQEKSYFLFPI
ncbi:MAG: hypothetical protein K6B45_11545 [Bacteroidaceae bacterium]|nr:hypothetical protein [Bacteroidaceae bacterium]